MNVFIDTNILLGLYQLSGPDLDEVNKIVKLAENDQLTLLLPQQVADEFWRNRERVIREALNTFAKSKVDLFVPNIVRVHEKALELKKAADLVNVLTKVLREETEEAIRKQELAADKLVDKLLKVCQPVSDDVLRRAQMRKQLGNPPGKADSLGDAVNWEWLLDQTETIFDLIIISSDGDFASELDSSQPREFLRREWARETGVGSLTLYKGLPEFLKAHFPDIKLSGEIDKLAAIEQLEGSLSFAGTHVAISRLNKFDEFTDNEIARIASAYDANNQIFLIAGDADVSGFAKKIISIAKSEKAKEAVKPVEVLLAQFAIDEEDDDDGPIPF